MKSKVNRFFKRKSSDCVAGCSYQQKRIISKVFLYLLTLTFCFLTSCKKFLSLDPPNSKIEAELVFRDDFTATSAISGIYLDLYDGFASGTETSLVSLAGLAADELKNREEIERSYLDFQFNEINPSNTFLLALWSSMYKTIYQCNSMLKGLEESTGVTPDHKNQLIGEASFVRAFCYFYLVNLFGDVPIVISTNFQENAILSRNPVNEVYEQILADLILAEQLLSKSYVASERIRPNSLCATALLARVYLYIGDWQRAEDKATNVIERTDIYSLLDDPNGVFLQGSREAIWQIRPPDGVTFLNEASTFGVIFGPKLNVLNSDIVHLMDDLDQRKTKWIQTISTAGDGIYLPYKYKKYATTGSLTEYAVIIRFAELVLIRAEARTRQEKLSIAITDLDRVRKRAGLTLIHDINPEATSEELMLLIENERRFEFMAEWGHRWFDLKRLGRANNVLALIKPQWTINDTIYPIPDTELSKNPKLKPQNAGY